MRAGFLMWRKLFVGAAALWAFAAVAWTAGTDGISSSVTSSSSGAILA